MAEVLEKVENVDGRLVERLQRLERLVEALLDKPIQVTITMPERPNMGCEREKLLVLLRKLEKEVRVVSPRAADIVSVYRERIEKVLEDSIDQELFG